MTRETRARLPHRRKTWLHICAQGFKATHSKFMIPRSWPQRRLGQKAYLYLRAAPTAADHSLLLRPASEFTRRIAPSAIDMAIFSGNPFGSAFST